MSLILAMLLDAALGEPKWLWDRLPHPAVLMGRLIGWCDARFNTGGALRLKGAAVIAGLVLGALLLGAALSLLGPVVEILVAAILLAQRSLADHVADVARALRLSLGDGRMMVARIVGRDAAQLDRSGVARGAIESAAENLSDGVIAPIFWFMALGLPGLLAYKVINTADSMIGYRTPRHDAFGWASAKLDDAVNWPAARVTAALLAASHLNLGAWRLALRDAGLHRSPNAGWPEAAMAGVLGVALSGPRSYEGRLQDEPFVHPEGRRALGPNDIDASVSALWRAWALCLAIVALSAVIA